MPAETKKVKGKWRVVHGGKVMKNRSGTAVDGGGHKSKAKATRQAAHINSNTK